MGISVARTLALMGFDALILQTTRVAITRNALTVATTAMGGRCFVLSPPKNLRLYLCGDTCE